MKKILAMLMIISLLLSVSVLAEEKAADTIEIDDEGTILTLSIQEHGYRSDERTIYFVTVAGYNVLTSGKYGAIEEIMPFDVAIVWGPEDYIYHSAYVVTMDPVTIAEFEKDDGTALEEPLYIMITPKGAEISDSFFYVIADEKFCSASEILE